MLLCTNSGLHSARTGKERYDLVNETIDTLADFGFEAIDIGFAGCISKNPLRRETILDGENYKENLDLLIKKCAERGLKISSTHLPFGYDYTDASSEDFAQNHEMCVRALIASEYIGAAWAVMHIENATDTVSYVKKLFKDSGVTQIGIAIENSPKIAMDEVIKACDILTEAGYKVGICFDTGHCNICRRFGFDDDNVAETILRLGKRIKVLHIHDNSGWHDNHLPPFQGKIPWADVMRALIQIGFAGDFNFEMINETVPESLRPSYLRHCVDVGRYLIDLFEEEKQ